MRIASMFLVPLLLVAVTHTRAEDKPDSPNPYANETPAERDARMAWLREAKFGMFIHWGVYAVPAGTYQGKQVEGVGEWIMCKWKIPMTEYQTYAKEFNPVKYDPDAWVRLAKEAGMKYIVITAKHHDGFALFDSKVSKWDVVDATPYGKDLIAPLAVACQKHDIKLGLYYSQAQDWNQGGSVHHLWDPAQRRNMDDYIRDIAVPQVREILSNYGPIAVLWWDTPYRMTDAQADQLLPLLKLQPGIIHNNRLRDTKKKTIYDGDTMTPEQHIPGTGLPGDWESCMTMNDTWGYKSYDHNWKSTEILVRNLIDIASKGGNYLLNVGPTAEGEVPEPSIERLKAIGAWMKVNNQSIYGTTASPCRTPEWGRITTKVEGDHTTLYLHVFDWSEDGSLFLPIINQVESCHLLADATRRFQTTTDERGTTVALTGSAPDAINSVVVLKLAGRPVVSDADKIMQGADGTVVLPGGKAIINNVLGSHTVYNATNDCIEEWTHPKATVDWTFTVKTPGIFHVTALTALNQGSSIKVSLGKQSTKANVPSTENLDTFKPVGIGNFTIDKAGQYTLHFEPIQTEWKPVNLRSVNLVPMTSSNER